MSLPGTSEQGQAGQPIRVVFACDEGYAMPLATMLRSLAESNQANWPLTVHVLSNDFSAASRERVEKSLPSGSAYIQWMQVDLTKFSHFPTLPHISAATYARFLIPELFPAEIRRVLYLDADMLALDDLRPVWETNLGGKPVGAARDVMDAILKSGEAGWDDVPRVPHYFNAGMLLMDLPTWRAERVSERAMDYLVAHPKTRMSDQDALNVACDGRWHELDQRWNFPCHRSGNLGELPAAKRPGIAHFITYRKPWLAQVRSQNASFYNQFRRRTLYARTMSERVRDAAVSSAAGVRNLLRRLRILAEEDRAATDTPVEQRSSNI